MRALVVGGTGLVGRALLDELAADATFERVVSFARRSQAPHPRVEPATLDAPVPEADVAFCALGTTIRAAGTQEAFRAVDHALVLRFARACRDRGVRSFHVVSGLGADERSRTFYLRVKGEMERDVRALGFEGACAYRPSLLLADREERRPRERAAIAAFRALGRAIPRAWRGIEPRVVARAMVRHAKTIPRGWHVHDNADLFELARGAAHVQAATTTVPTMPE